MPDGKDPLKPTSVGKPTPRGPAPLMKAPADPTKAVTVLAKPSVLNPSTSAFAGPSGAQGFGNAVIDVGTPRGKPTAQFTTDPRGVSEKKLHPPARGGADHASPASMGQATSQPPARGGVNAERSKTVSMQPPAKGDSAAERPQDASTNPPAKGKNLIRMPMVTTKPVVPQMAPRKLALPPPEPVQPARNYVRLPMTGDRPTKPQMSPRRLPPASAVNATTPVNPPGARPSASPPPQDAQPQPKAKTVSPENRAQFLADRRAILSEIVEKKADARSSPAANQAELLRLIQEQAADDAESSRARRRPGAKSKKRDVALRRPATLTPNGPAAEPPRKNRAPTPVNSAMPPTASSPVAPRSRPDAPNEGSRVIREFPTKLYGNIAVHEVARPGKPPAYVVHAADLGKLKEMLPVAAAMGATIEGGKPHFELPSHAGEFAGSLRENSDKQPEIDEEKLSKEKSSGATRNSSPGMARGKRSARKDSARVEPSPFEGETSLARIGFLENRKLSPGPVKPMASRIPSTRNSARLPASSVSPKAKMSPREDLDHADEFEIGGEPSTPGPGNPPGRSKSSSTGSRPSGSPTAGKRGFTGTAEGSTPNPGSSTKTGASAEPKSSSSRPTEANPNDASRQILEAMARADPNTSTGAPITFDRLRPHLIGPLADKDTFDQAVLQMGRDGLVSLHRHDFPKGQTEDAIRQMVPDGLGKGEYYFTISRRSTAPKAAGGGLAHADEFDLGGGPSPATTVSGQANPTSTRKGSSPTRGSASSTSPDSNSPSSGGPKPPRKPRAAKPATGAPGAANPVSPSAAPASRRSGGNSRKAGIEPSTPSSISPNRQQPAANPAASAAVPESSGSATDPTPTPAAPATPARAKASGRSPRATATSAGAPASSGGRPAPPSASAPPAVARANTDESGYPRAMSKVDKLAARKHLNNTTHWHVTGKKLNTQSAGLANAVHWAIRDAVDGNGSPDIAKAGPYTIQADIRDGRVKGLYLKLPQGRYRVPLEPPADGSTASAESILASIKRTMRSLAGGDES